MAAEHCGEPSYYDFLVEEPEMIPAAPPTQFDTVGQAHASQQPISPSDRTRRPVPTNPHHTSPPPPLLHSLPTTPLYDQSRASSRGAQPHMAAGFDLHGQMPREPAHSGFAAPMSPALSGSMAAVPWSLYGAAHPTTHIDPASFDFEPPPSGAMMPHVGAHGSHPSMQPPDDPSLAYGHDIVSPESYHSQQSRYAFGSWGDLVGHESSTPTITTPAGTVESNPWAEIDDVPNFEDTPQAYRPRKTPRSRRGKSETTGSTESQPETAVSPSSMSQNSRTSAGSKSTSMASTSTASSRTSKLRSASRTSKNSHQRPGDTLEDRRTRASHNLVEKQYRNRLNAQFESLLSALPDKSRGVGTYEEDSDGNEAVDRRVSKGEVLERARKHIQTLERERSDLERENNELVGSLHQLQGQLSSEHGSPLEYEMSSTSSPYEKGRRHMREDS